jgi:hypothetical protein
MRVTKRSVVCQLLFDLGCMADSTVSPQHCPELQRNLYLVEHELQNPPKADDIEYAALNQVFELANAAYYVKPVFGLLLDLDPM